MAQAESPWRGAGIGLGGPGHAAGARGAAAARVCRRALERLAASPWVRNRKALGGLCIVAGFVLMALLAPWLSPSSPTAMAFAPFASPSRAHPLGTTAAGQDILSQVLWGSRASLLVGFLAGGASTALAVLVGMLAGYAGGVTDEALSLLTNIFLVLPGLPLIIVLAAYSPFHGLWPIAVVITVTGWAFGARILRAQTLTLRGRDFVQAARVSGEGTWRIVFGEILPNMTSLIVSVFLFAVIYAVLAEASLEFLGLGDSATVTWGTVLYWADNSQAIVSGAWWWFVPPGACIGLLGAGLALVNYALDEITNPRLTRGARR